MKANKLISDFLKKEISIGSIFVIQIQLFCLGTIAKQLNQTIYF